MKLLYFNYTLTTTVLRFSCSKFIHSYIYFVQQTYGKVQLTVDIVQQNIQHLHHDTEMPTLIILLMKISTTTYRIHTCVIVT